MIKFLLFFMSFSAFGAPLGLKSLKIKSGINFDYVDGEDIKTRVFGYNFRFDVKDDFSEDLDLFFSASAILETGSNEAVAGLTEFAPLETIVLNEGGIDYHPIDLLRFKAGALSLREYHSPLLVSNAPFVGAQQKIDLGFVYFKALQAIPGNNRFARRVGRLDTGTPSFYMETLGLKWSRYFKLEVSHYLYRDLAPNIAQDSRQIGNSVRGTGEASRFNYGFNGYNATLSTLLAFGKSAIKLNGQYIVNDEAPTQRNEGFLGGVTYRYGGFGLEFESFENQSDTSPGFYNNKYYGHNNIQGQAVGMTMVDKKSEFFIKYYVFEPIEENSLQFRTEIITLNFNLKYDL